MPNWCSNKVTFAHADPAMIKRVVDAYNRGELFSEFKPCPQDLLDTTSPASGEIAVHNTETYGHPDWYTWCISNWGTKWDMDPGGNTIDLSEGEKAIDLWFDTAWSPPIPFLKTMEDHGFTVDAFYYEPGMGFCGRYTMGEDDYYDIQGDADWVQKNVPVEIDDVFDIVNNMESIEEDEDA